MRNAYENNPDLAVNVSRFFTDRWANPVKRAETLAAQAESRNNDPARYLRVSEKLKNSIWITNGVERRRIQKDDPIPEGFQRGWKVEKN